MTNKKENKPEAYEKYPLASVLISNLVYLSIYVIGIYLLYLIYPIFSLLFLIYILIMEYSIYKSGCSCCYYYGKRCAFGRGKIAPIIVKRKNPKEFCKKQVSFKKLIPSLLIVFIPVIAGIYLMIQDFKWEILILTIWILAINFIGNPIIYGNLACPHCKQGRTCCPACEYFMKTYEPRGKRKK